MIASMALELKKRMPVAVPLGRTWSRRHMSANRRAQHARLAAQAPTSMKKGCEPYRGFFVGVSCARTSPHGHNVPAAP